MNFTPIDLPPKGKPSASMPEKLTLVRSANECLAEASGQPELKTLFGTLWHQGEIAFLFADTGVGKSLLAVQIADALSMGKPQYCQMRNEAGRQRVLLYDFELSDRMFHRRYSDGIANSHVFADELFRGLLSPESLELSTAFEERLMEAIESDIVATEAQVVVVDNITALSMKTTAAADSALTIMKQLKKLQLKYNLTLLVLAHTTKLPQGLPIQLNHMGGSKHLSNFADSVFALGRSVRGEDFRYIKHLKARNSELLYHQENVLVLEKEKRNNFLRFNLIEMGSEMEELGVGNADDKAQKAHTVKILHEQGKSVRDIAKETGIPRSTVQRYLKD